VIERGPEAADRARLAALANDPPLPPNHLEACENGQALRHKQGGLVYPDQALPFLQEGATRHPVEVSRVEHRDGVWCALTDAGEVLAKADICVIAAGTGFQSFVDVGGTLRARAGQLSYFRRDKTYLSTPICGGAYSAQTEHLLTFGATFEAWPLSEQTPPPVTRDRHIHNKTILSDIAPELAQQIDVDVLGGRSSIRVTTPDHLPVAGPAPGDQSGLYVLAGLGSRGYTTAFLCAEVIACMATNEPAPVESDIIASLSPDRFIKRAQKKASSSRAMPAQYDS
jgi:tRNA 5-methylaminomethyl-2-thiouridine biosynthesis bifunctional protein